MQWFLMSLGAILGYMIDSSALAVSIGLLIGLEIANTIHIRILIKDNKALHEKLSTLDINKELKKRLNRVDSSTVSTQTENIPTANPFVKEAITPLSVAVNKPLQPPTETTTNVPISHPQPVVEQIPVSPPVADTRPIITTNNSTLTAHTSDIPISPAPISTESMTDPWLDKGLPPRVNRPTSPPKKTVAPPQENFITKGYQAIYGWLVGGNTILRVGAIILFLGLAFLLRYATEGMVFPVSSRYIGVTIVALVLIALGWRLRAKQANYGLILQGTGVAVLYLTAYASMYLHQLLSANTVFSLLLIITIASASLAILQNSISLASAAALGGFAAPLLASSGSGSHVALFSYFILLNAGILTIAWFKTWRPLNLIGFVGTFGIGFSWGITAYRPELFWTTEPFLIIFFLMYICIGLLFARRKLYEAKHAPTEANALLHWSIRQTDYIDATVIFGTPIVGFGLQYSLSHHIPYGAAMSAFVLGVFYLCQALICYTLGTKRIVLLGEICLALGVIFSTLAIPLALDAQWTSAAWAVEGAGIYWIGIRQQRNISRLFALLLQAGATIAFLQNIQLANDTLLNGPSLGTVMLGMALLFSFYQAHKQPEELQPFEQTIKPLLSLVGLSFIYLLAPFHLLAQGTAISWAIAGIVTLWLGLRIKAPSFLIAALAIQLLAGILFATSTNYAELGNGLGQNWYQLILFSLFGLLLMVNSYFIAKDESIKEYSLLSCGTNLVLLLGLIFINLALLFIFPWRVVAGIWAISGLLIIGLALKLDFKLAFYFGLALQLIGGSTFISHYGEITSQLTPFAHIRFWTPLIIASVALIAAWRLQRPTELAVSPSIVSKLSQLLLIWGGAWWAFALANEIIRIAPTINWQITGLLLATAISLWLAGIVAKRAKWSELSLATALLLPIATLLFCNNVTTPFANYGWLAWLVLFTVHLVNLKQLNELLSHKIQSLCHIAGLWLCMAVLSCELHHLLTLMTKPNANAWYWLVWMILPSLWLLLVCYKTNLPWPIKQFSKEYRELASLPLAILMVIWFCLANTLSDGTTALAPYLPVLNPLELGLLLAIASSGKWVASYINNDQGDNHEPNNTLTSLIGIALFALVTCMVFRAAYHWADIPFKLSEQLHSMLVQASLSILWTAIALALMIVGHKKVYRKLWLVGASLITLVVVKLFFVELGNSGSLARIISFIVVGTLLLIVGYFAPLPPKQTEQSSV